MLALYKVCCYFFLNNKLFSDLHQNNFYYNHIKIEKTKDFFVWNKEKKHEDFQVLYLSDFFYKYQLNSWTESTHLKKFFNFISRKQNSVFVFYTMVEKENMCSLFFTRINYLYFSYGLNNYLELSIFFWFIQKKKKILVILDEYIMPSIYKIIIKSNTVYFYFPIFDKAVNKYFLTNALFLLRKSKEFF